MPGTVPPLLAVLAAGVLALVGCTGVAVATSRHTDGAPPPVSVPHCAVVPVDAPVVDPFDAPDEPWGSGNRGLEYASTPGQPVVAAVAGTVTFAGPIAGRHYVTVEIAAGLRTTYSFLLDVSVTRGDRVAAGEVLGHATTGFHLGLRHGSTYLDPARLFAGPCPGGHAHLVPLEG